jgi:tRNA/rRNA methyltransferase
VTVILIVKFYFMIEQIRIVLVEPAGALNVGSIARVMKNMGLRQLVLVNPRCDRNSEEARRMAVHAADVLEAAEIVDSLPAALQGCERAIATAVRTRSPDVPLEHPRTALPWLLDAPSALIFGAEERGLSNAELQYAQRLVYIPASADYVSLNLAQAVAVCCYELTQAALEPASSSALHAVAAIDALEGYYGHLESVLLQIGYLHPHTAASRMEKFRRLFNRAQLSSEEVSMLRGILRQMEWAATQQGE